jgi:hypothetical protein
MARRIALLLALAAAATGFAPAAQPRCTQEALTVRGVSVTIAYCVTGAAHSAGDEVIVPVTASYAASSGSVSLTRELHFVGGESSSRVLESLELARIGMSGTLHLTLVYTGGTVRVEGALLTPGGITIK